MSENTHFNNTNTVNIASYTTHTSALGPGIRAVVWVQGCPLHCAGCVAPGWIPFIQSNLMMPSEILERLDVEKIDGLTFSGGEPFEQASGLAELARLAREKKDLNIICFTGYRYERLLRQPPNNGVYELLNEVDVLIDGPYIESLNDSIGLRGSSNQHILHLTSRLKMYDLENQKRRIELTIRDGEMAFVGIPTPGIKTVIDRAYQSGTERMDEDERL